MDINPVKGDYAFKYAKSTLVCSRCGTQVKIVDFHENGIPIYKCVTDTCPAFNKERRPFGKHPSAFWVEFTQVFEYRKVKVL